MKKFRLIGLAQRLVLAITLLLIVSMAGISALSVSLVMVDRQPSSDGGAITTLAYTSALRQTESTDPQLSLSVGVLATDNERATLSGPLPSSLVPSIPGSVPSWTGTLNSMVMSETPVPTMVNHVDGYDRVTIALIVENLGGSGVKLSNIHLQGVAPSAVVTDVTDFNIQGRTGGGSLLDVELLPGGLFGEGIVLNHPDEYKSVLSGYSPTSGENMAVVTLDLSLHGSIIPSSSVPLSVRIVGYTFEEDGSEIVAEFPLENISAVAEFQTKLPEVTSRLLGVSQNHTTRVMSDVVPVTIGDIITYEVTLAMPEGRSPEGFFKSELDRGFALVDIISVEASDNVTTSLEGGFDAVRESVRLIETTSPLPNQGQKFDLSFGELIVTEATGVGADSEGLEDSKGLEDSEDSSDQPSSVVRMIYRVVALNNERNFSQPSASPVEDSATVPALRNQYLQWCWSAEHHVVTANTPNVSIVEPDLHVRQFVDIASATNGMVEPNSAILSSSVLSDAITAGDVLTITANITHSAASSANAYEVSLEHVLPPELQYIDDTVMWLAQDGRLIEPSAMQVLSQTIETEEVFASHSRGGAAAAVETTIHAAWNELNMGDGGAIQFQVIAVDDHLPLSLDERTQLIESQSAVRWSSVPGEFNQSLSTYHDLAAERTGRTTDVGGAVNDYVSKASNPLLLTIPATPPQQARVQADLSVTNLTRSRGATRPGDTLRYNLLVQNIGNTPAVNVQVTNPIDANLNLIGNSIQLDGSSLAPSAADGDSLIFVNLQTLALNETAKIQYDVVVGDSLLVGTSQIVNQALIHGDNFPLAPSNNPDTVEILDPTLLYTVDDPQLFVFNRVELSIDADADQRISKGDTVAYDVRTVNRGHGPADQVQLYSRIEHGLQLDIDSVQAFSGTVTAGLEPGESTLQADLATVAAGETKRFTFEAVVTAASGNALRRINNQSVAVADNHAAVLSDNPNTITQGDATSIDLADASDIVATKSQYFLADRDGNGHPSAGDHIGYRITIRNYGSVMAENVTFTDLLDANTSLISGTVQLSSDDQQVTAVVHSETSTTTVALEIPMLDAAGSFDADQIVLSYVAEINAPTARSENVSSSGIIRNQGEIVGDSIPTVFTHDPFRVFNNSQTETFTDLVPRMAILKQDVLLLDSDGNNELSPLNDTYKPERLLYQIWIANIGNMTAQSVVLEDTPDSYSRLIPDTVRTSRGTIVVGSSADSKSVIVELGPMARQQVTGAPERAIVSFEVELTELEVPRPIRNSAGVLVDIDNKETDLEGQYTLVSDDPETIAVDDATITTVTQTPTGAEQVDEPDTDKPNATDNIALPSVYVPIVR